MVTYRTLEGMELVNLHETFLRAFSDYQVSMELPFDSFKFLLESRGYVPEMSMGAFDGSTLVGFVLNGIRMWDGKKTAYDTGTGVVPEYRGKGISSELIDRLDDLLKENDIEQYLLEVIKTNEAGVNLYKKHGFSVNRSFKCYSLKDTSAINGKWEVEKVPVDELDVDILKEFWDFRPSWQNSFDTVLSHPDSYTGFVCRDDDVIGYGILDDSPGDIPQLAVRKGRRRENVGKSILASMSQGSEKLSMLNVDERCEGMERFLKSNGFEVSVEQYEMLKKL